MGPVADEYERLGVDQHPHYCVVAIQSNNGGERNLLQTYALYSNHNDISFTDNKF